MNRDDLDLDLPPSVEYSPGPIRVSYIHQPIDHDDVKVYYIDCDTKYPEVVLSHSSDSPDIEVHLMVGANTLRHDESNTRVSSLFVFKVPEHEADRWEVVFNGHVRYDLRVVLWRHPEVDDD